MSFPVSTSPGSGVVEDGHDAKWNFSDVYRVQSVTFLMSFPVSVGHGSGVIEDGNDAKWNFSDVDRVQSVTFLMFFPQKHSATLISGFPNAVENAVMDFNVRLGKPDVHIEMTAYRYLSAQKNLTLCQNLTQ